MRHLKYLLIFLLALLSSSFTANSRGLSLKRIRPFHSTLVAYKDEGRAAEESLKAICLTTIELMSAKSIDTLKKQHYSLRKYKNVTQFYRRIAKNVTQICLDNNVPPAAILAIAGLESGWNQGYVGQITGNIMSLGVRKGDIELPALRLPRHKISGKIIYDSLQIPKHSKDELIWENRPPSLKKDYRPKPYAGTSNQLAYFKYHPKERAKAHLDNITDFVTLFISRKSRIKAYRDARELMDQMVAQHGKEILLLESTAIQFVNGIGGKVNSFNYRKTWPIKVVKIIKSAGLTQLTTTLHKDQARFDDVW